MLPHFFQIRTDIDRPFTAEEIASLPEQQQILERGLTMNRHVARSVSALATETGLSEDAVREYCLVSKHISRSPLKDYYGNEFFGLTKKLKSKYAQNKGGEFIEAHTPSLFHEGQAQLEYEVFISYASGDCQLRKVPPTVRLTRLW